MADSRERKGHVVRMPGLQEKRADRIFCAGLFFIAVIIFLSVGSRQPVLFDDSKGYMWIECNEGVMPLYPLFIFLNQYLLGDLLYLQAVIVEQALLAAFSMVFLVETVRKEFALKVWECCIIFCFLLYPYTIEMPTGMMTQIILTEGVAYSFFYLAVVFFLKAVWRRSYGWFAGAVGMIFILAMTRSQMQIMFGVCGIIFWYIVCMRRKQGDRKQIYIRILAGLVGCLIISLAGVMLVSRISGGYQTALDQKGRFYHFALRIQAPEDYRERMELEEAQAALEAAREEAGQVPDEVQEEVSEEELLYKEFLTSQYVSLIFSRGMYEADAQDVSLFEDEMLQGLFLRLYEAADAAGQLHSYAGKGLWMWRDIVGGIGMVGKTCILTPSEYYVSEHPEVILSDDFSNIRNAHLQTIGFTLIKAHFGRFLYHTMMLLPQAFVSTIFFQIAPIYLLCHLVTLFLYLSAFALMVWAYADKRADKRYAEFMAFVLGSNVVLVFIISVVFFGQQRYLVYNFGVFYAAYCLLLQQLWRCRIKELVQRRIRKDAGNRQTAE